MKYYGFFQLDASITQGVHQGAIDIKTTDQWYEWLFAPFQDSSLDKIPFKVIRVNAVDTSSHDVVYSAIQRDDGKENVIFAYFHTGECPYKIGDIIHSGDYLCKTSPNGQYSGPHCHLSPRNGKMSVFYTDPLSVILNYPGGSANLGFVPGKPKIEPDNPFVVLNLQPGTEVKNILNKRLNIRMVPDITGTIVGQIDPNMTTVVTTNAPQSIINDGYEWAPIKGGFIAVQDQTQKYISVTETDTERIIRLEKEKAALTVDNKALQDQNNKLSSDNEVFKAEISRLNKKLADINNIITS